MRRYAVSWLGRQIVSLGNRDLQHVRISRHHVRTLCITGTTPEKNSYNVGIIGCGRVAGIHLKNVLRHPRLNLQWVMEENEARIQEVKTLYSMDKNIPFVPYSSRQELLADKSLDGVVILSPTPTHTPYICDSLKQGKAVFTEKPAGESTADITTCYETAEKYGKPLLQGFMLRFDEAFGDVKKAVESGGLGELQVMKATTRDSPKPSYAFLESADNSGCNILADLAVHQIDMLVWLTGAEEPESIYVNGHIHDQALLACGEPDAMVAVIKYRSGVLTTMDIVRESVYGYDMRFEVFGSGGVATAENPRESSSVINGRHGGQTRRLYNSFPDRFEKAYEKELDHFVDCMDGSVTPLITKKESIRVAEIIENGVLSYSKRQPVNF